MYLVPLYQRLYVWNETDQWGPLWEDIASVAKAVAAKTTISPHFFGALILKSETPEKSGFWRVIDGQQRLTTTQLVIAAVTDELTHREEDSTLTAKLRELIVNPEYSKHRYKMRHSGKNYVGFVKVMRANGDEKAIAEIGGEMASCYLFFRRKARNWFDTNPGDNFTAALTDTLRTKLQTVAIQLREDEPEHSIFETLNARGVALTEWDKIRNYLLYRTEADQDYFFQEYLEPFDDRWWRSTTGSGADRRPRTDRFVDYWLESRLHRPVPAQRVFREFQAHTEHRRGDDLIADIESLIVDAEYYRRFEIGSDQGDDIEVVFHERRRRMNLGAFWPFLLGLCRSDLEQNAFHLLLSTLESWFVRRWINGHRASGYPDRAIELLGLVSGETNGFDVADKVIDRFTTTGVRTGRWPSDEEVKSKVATEPDLASGLRRLVLEAVERHVTPKHAEKAIPRPGELHIEHIMPRGWRSDAWPIHDDSEEARAQRTGWIWTLGNLTLVHGSVNQSMSNAAWAVKKEKILENSNLFLNKELLKRAPEEWNESAIRERGEWLAEKVCEIWPHADTLRRRLGRE